MSSAFDDVQSMLMKQLILQKNEVTPESTFTELAMDEVDVVEAILDFEERYEIEITDDEAVEWRTVQDMGALFGFADSQGVAHG